MSKRLKRTLEGRALVEGFDLLWELIREPQWCTADGYKGACLSVRLADESCRELIIEFPIRMKPNGMAKLPQRPAIPKSLVERCIAAAIKAGWDPASRGKAEVYYPAEPPD